MNILNLKTKSYNETYFNKKWFIIDATGKNVGRLVSRIVIIMMGKHNPYYTPHVNCGDHIIIINTNKVIFSGKKLKNKEYIRYTGYPGGKKIITAEKQILKDSRKIIEKAVKGMLPKNRLRNKIYKNLHVYHDSKHIHEAQKPILIEI